METLCFVFLLLRPPIPPRVESQIPLADFSLSLLLLAPTLCAAVQPEDIMLLRQGLEATYKIIHSLVFLKNRVYFII